MTSLNLNGKLNPLDVDIILHNILTHLPTRTVSQCRQVSSKWEEIGRKILLRRRDHQAHLHCANVGDFLHLFEGPLGPPPFPTIRWNCWSFNTPDFRRMIAKVKGTIRVLVLDMRCPNNTEEELPDHLVQTCGSGSSRDEEDRVGLYFKRNVLEELATSLEVLDIDELWEAFDLSLDPEGEEEEWAELSSLRSLTFPNQEGLDLSPSYWGGLFQAAKNLSSVYFNQAEQMGLLAVLQEKGRLKGLKRLRIETLTKVDVELLLTSGIQPEDFKLNTISSDVKASDLEKLLTRFSQGLKTLAFGSPENDGKMLIRLPKMENLRELGLFYLEDSLITLGGINFRQDTPKLESLSVSSAYGKLNWKEFFGFVDERTEAVRSLRSLSISMVVSDKACCEFLGRLFPNVERLRLEFPRARFLRQVFLTWPKLRDLYLYMNLSGRSQSMDAGLCGFSGKQKKEMEEVLSRGREKEELAAVEIGRLIGVSNLQELQRLTIEVTPVCPEIEDPVENLLLSDSAVYFSLAKLKDLRLLKIGRSQISVPAINYLKSELEHLSTIDIRGCDGPGVFSPEESEELVQYIRYYVSNENS